MTADAAESEAEQVSNASRHEKTTASCCEIEGFVETHGRKLRGILL